MTTTTITKADPYSLKAARDMRLEYAIQAVQYMALRRREGDTDITARIAVQFLANINLGDFVFMRKLHIDDVPEMMTGFERKAMAAEWLIQDIVGMVVENRNRMKAAFFSRY